MPFTMPNYPILTPEQANPFASILSQAFNTYGKVQGFKEKEAAIQKALLENKFLPREKESEIALRGAQSGLYGQQAEKLRQEIPFIKAKEQASIDYDKARAEKEKYESLKTKYLIDQLNNYQQNKESPILSGEGINSNNSEKPSIYGIETPQPTQRDIANKMLFGIDSFSDKQKDAIQQQHKQADLYLESSIANSKQIESLNDSLGLLNQLKFWQGQIYGPSALAPYTPNFSTAAKNSAQIRNELSLGGIERVRGAMDSARFAVVDTNIALGMKPQENWDGATFDRYITYMDAVKSRLNQKNEFINFMKNNPSLGADKATSDALWSLYQDQYPITSRQGNSFIVHDRNEWRKFATPEAVQSIKKTGDYRPISSKDVNEDNIKETMKATGLSRKQVIDELEKRNIIVKGKYK